MTDKNSKGLRHFSLKVCEKVETKKRTTYNEVADELVQEFGNQSASHDEKNIRRRVYDALNVLMAMDIIARDKKEITWIGLPATVAMDEETLRSNLDVVKDNVEKKRLHLQELLLQQIAFKNLLNHNREMEEKRPKMDVDVGSDSAADKVYLPFILVNTNKHTAIDCEISKEQNEVVFKFNRPFEIHDDNEILRRLGLHYTTRDELQDIIENDRLVKDLPIFQKLKDNNRSP